MFSNQSVRVQPSCPATAKAASPESERVCPALSISSYVAGGLTPAWSSASGLYQTVDLWAALKYRPYRVSSTLPYFFHTGAKLASTDFWVVSDSGSSQPFLANCWSTPTCGTITTSGALPPSILLPTTVETLSPVDMNWVLAPVFAENASSTFWKFFCSLPDQTPATVTVWPSSVLSPPPAETGSSLPQAVAPRARTRAVQPVSRVVRRRIIVDVPSEGGELTRFRGRCLR